MTTSISRLTAAGVAALAITLVACGTTDPGVQAGRSDRTRADGDTATITAPPASEPVAPDSPATETSTTGSPTTDEPAPTLPVAEQPPAPTASGPGSVSADDLASVFLPANPDLLGPSSDLTDGRDAQTFLDEEMTFSGMDPVIEIAGAPITFAAYVITQPTFADDGQTTDAPRFRASYRMAVEYDSDADLDERAEALRDELRPIVEAANPGAVVTDTFVDEVFAIPAYGLAVGSEDDPSTVVEISQHYVLVPRLVEDPLLAVNVRRNVTGDAVVPAELPSRDRFVDDALQAQMDLFQSVPAPVREPAVRSHAVVINIPSAGAPATNRSVHYDVDVPADEFEAYIDRFAEVVEADEYEAVENFGEERSFDHVEERRENEFIITREDGSVTVRIQGDVTAYPG